MGNDIAVDGNRLAVGTPFVTDKAVTVMTRTAGTWALDTPDAIIPDPDPATDDQWGSNVAIEDDTLVVGALLETNETGVDTGGAHFYERTSSGWESQGNVTGPGFESLFGRSLAYENDTLVVGAPHQNRSGINLGGGVHIYQEKNGSWNRTQLLTPPANDTDGLTHHFGYSLDFEGNQLLIGSPPKALLYEVENGTADHVTTFQPPSDYTGDALHYRFGWRVAVDGDKALIGSPDTDEAFGYDRTPTGWELGAELEHPDDPRKDTFILDPDAKNYGRDVDLVDGQAVVAASTGTVRSLRGNVFLYDASDWSHEKTIRPPEDARDADFADFLEARQGELFVHNERIRPGGSLYVFGPDSDRDGLGDTYEAESLGSDPMDRDTDGDLFSDYTERFGRVLDSTDSYAFRGRSDPANPASVPAPVLYEGVTATEETRGEEVPVTDDHGPIPRLD